LTDKARIFVTHELDEWINYFDGTVVSVPTQIMFLDVLPDSVFASLREDLLG